MLNNIVDYLTDGYWQQQGGARRKFDIQPGGTLTANIAALTPAGQQLATWALEAWADVTGINFSLVTTAGADITFDDNEPGGFSTASVTDGVITASHVNVSATSLDEYGTGMDSYSFLTYIHEIGHALGLGHPGRYNGGYPDFLADTVSFYDSWQTTVMSYISQDENVFAFANYAHPVTPMIADIAAVHTLYGKPESVHAGNTTYGYNANTGTYLDEYFRLWTGEDNPFSRTANISQPSFFDYGNTTYLAALNPERTVLFVYENTGTPSSPAFDYLASLDWGDPIQDYQFIDIKEDGYIDIIVADYTGVYLLESTYAGENLYLLLAGAYTGKFEFVDLDGDSDYDVFEIIYGDVYIRENIGTPTVPVLTDAVYVDSLYHSVHDFKFADLDNDNDFDLMAVDDLGGIHYYENIGTSISPYFAEDVYFGNPLDSVYYGGAPIQQVRDISFADVDNDGDIDILSADNYNIIHYFENAGTADNFHFVPTNFNRQTTLTIYDTDGNDLLDLRTDLYDQWIDLSPEGISHVYGLTGNLVIAHDTTIERVIAGRGDDVILGNAANNTLHGNTGDDLLFGNDRDDTLKGYHGDDFLRGDSGNDSLIGGRGADRMVGGLGDDVFVLMPADGYDYDYIRDFKNGNDRIDLRGFDTFRTLDDLSYYLADNGYDGIIDLSDHGGGYIVLENFTEPLGLSDFIVSDGALLA